LGRGAAGVILVGMSEVDEPAPEIRQDACSDRLVLFHVELLLELGECGLELKYINQWGVTSTTLV